MFRILVTDTLADSGLAILRGQGDVDLYYRPGLAGSELLEGVGQADALITRSGTAVTEELLAYGTRLKVVGRTGVGLDNVDVPACTRRGVLVINAPTANILSATEHTMAMLLSLCRNIPGANASVRGGEWKRSKFMGVELAGKTLGVVGLGRIGSRVATRARVRDKVSRMRGRASASASSRSPRRSGGGSDIRSSISPAHPHTSCPRMAAPRWYRMRSIPFCLPNTGSARR